MEIQGFKKYMKITNISYKKVCRNYPLENMSKLPTPDILGKNILKPLCLHCNIKTHCHNEILD